MILCRIFSASLCVENIECGTPYLAVLSPLDLRQQDRLSLPYTWFLQLCTELFCYPMEFRHHAIKLRCNMIYTHVQSTAPILIVVFKKNHELCRKDIEQVLPRISSSLFAIYHSPSICNILRKLMKILWEDIYAYNQLLYFKWFYSGFELRHNVIKRVWDF